MNDLVDEVEEALRHDKAAQFMKKNGIYIAGLLIAIVLGTGGYSVYTNMQNTKYERLTSEYLAALKPVTPNDTALENLAKLSGSNTSVLAKFQLAATMQAQNKFDDARSLYNAIILEPKLANEDHDFARARLASMELDLKNVDAVFKITALLKDKNNPFRFQAYELEALAHWVKGDSNLAKKSLELLINDIAAPANYKQRAQAIIGLIDGGVAFQFGTN